jgi:hypothetical protein
MTDGFEIDVEVRGGERAVVVLHNLPEDVLKEVRLAMVDAANLLRTKAIRGMQRTPKTGRRYSRQFGKARKAGGRRRALKWHTASSPGQYPAIDRGGLVASLLVDVYGDYVQMGSATARIRKGKSKGSMQYPIFLEEGTKRMGARPWLEPTLLASRGAIRRMIERSVKKGIP